MDALFNGSPLSQIILIIAAIVVAILAARIIIGLAVTALRIVIGLAAAGLVVYLLYLLLN